MSYQLLTGDNFTTSQLITAAFVLLALVLVGIGVSCGVDERALRRLMIALDRNSIEQFLSSAQHMGPEQSMPNMKRECNLGRSAKLT